MSSRVACSAPRLLRVLRLSAVLLAQWRASGEAGAPAKPMLTSAERAERAAKELAEAKANAPSKVAAKQQAGRARACPDTEPDPELTLSLTFTLRLPPRIL